jgi:hypothetical protein
VGQAIESFPQIHIVVLDRFVNDQKDISDVEIPLKVLNSMNIRILREREY